MVIWCGDLQLNQTFKGVIFNLYGDGSAFGASNCATIAEGPATNGVISNNGIFCQCWLYAQGGDDTRAGIEIDPGSTVKFLPGVDFNFKEFLDEVLNDDPPTEFRRSELAGALPVARRGIAPGRYCVVDELQVG